MLVILLACSDVMCAQEGAQAEMKIEDKKRTSQRESQGCEYEAVRSALVCPMQRHAEGLSLEDDVFLRR